VLAGQVKIRIDQRYPLAEAATAHRELEARKTTGSTVLMPEKQKPAQQWPVLDQGLARNRLCRAAARAPSGG